MAGGPKFNRQAERHCLPFSGFSCAPLPGLPTCSSRPSRISWKAPHIDSYTYSSPTLFELISFSLSTTKFSTAELEYLCDPKLPLVCLCFPKACRRVPQTSTEGTFTARGPVNLVQELGQVTVTGPCPIPFTRPVLPPRNLLGRALTLTKALTQRNLPWPFWQNLHPPDPPPFPVISLLCRVGYLLCVLFILSMVYLPYYYVKSRSGIFVCLVQSWIPSAQHTVNVQ